MPVIARDSAYLDALDPRQLYGELALAAHRAAESRLCAAKDGWPAMCRECGQRHPDDLLSIPHADSCRTGAVVRVLFALSRAELYQAFHRPSQPGKESTAQQDAGDAAVRDSRPPARLIAIRADHAGLYGEPWAVDADGAVHNADGVTIAEPLGCELVEPDDVLALERMALCVNHCNGISNADLRRTGGAN